MKKDGKDEAEGKRERAEVVRVERKDGVKKELE
jgi:hypothetical protein